mgnify:CR=1 FL=1
MNAAGPHGRVLPAKDPSEFQNGNDNVDWSYNGILVAPGESQAVMHIIGQHRNLSDAVSMVLAVNKMPVEIYANISNVANIVNWDMCYIAVVPVTEQTTFCTSSPSVTFDISRDGNFTFNGKSATPSNNQITETIVNGNNIVSYTYTQFAECTATPASFQFNVPPADFTISVTTKNGLPSASASGGFGEYVYSWSFGSGGDLSSVFGKTATVTVVDKEQCIATKDIEIPSQGKISSGSQLVASLVGFAVAYALF